MPRRAAAAGTARRRGPVRRWRCSAAARPRTCSRWTAGWPRLPSRPGRPSGRPGREAAVGHRDDSPFDRRDPVRADAQHRPCVVAQRACVARGVQDRAGEFGVLHQCRTRPQRQYVAERQPVRRLRGAEVHQIRRRRIEDGPLGLHEPAREVLQQRGARRRQAARRPRVEDVPRVQHDPVAPLAARHDPAAVRRVADLGHGRRHPAESGAGGEAPLDQRLEGVRPEHLVAQRGGPGDRLRPVPAPYAQPLPGRGQHVVVLAARGLPEAPGARWRAQRAGRSVDQDDPYRGAVRRAAQPVREAQPGRTGAHDDDLGTRHSAPFCRTGCRAHRAPALPGTPPAPPSILPQTTAPRTRATRGKRVVFRRRPPGRAGAARAPGTGPVHDCSAARDRSSRAAARPDPRAGTRCSGRKGASW